jgi:hypothetical protein
MMTAADAALYIFFLLSSPCFPLFSLDALILFFFCSFRKGDSWERKRGFYGSQTIWATATGVGFDISGLGLGGNLNG